MVDSPHVLYNEGAGQVVAQPPSEKGGGGQKTRAAVAGVKLFL